MGESCNETANCVDSFLALDSFVLFFRLEDVLAVDAEVESCHETASYVGPFEIHPGLALDPFVLFLHLEDVPAVDAEVVSGHETVRCFGEILYRKDVLSNSNLLH